MQALPFGERSFLVEVPDAVAALSLARWVRASGLAVVDVVPAARTVLLDGVADPDGVAAVLGAWRPEERAEPGPLVELAVVYDGADLDDVAQRWGTDAAGVAERLAGTELVAAFSGFAPGFSYLAGLPDRLAVPRLATPRPRVPAGSVAVADTWCGVYPTASPGGWRLLGHTSAELWDPSRDSPALLAPGTRVRLVPA
ncbi:allophanate hydrolase subunit 1 [Nocardioides sp. SYSU D00038]|uniref:5-oxoprolinase subunit B family protein n=1 Tax=Nocardioides sp. SYSU D00038 TaxID=2812554 RepID=UPI001967CFA7|nr:allophanate hydrolase subunit 1 [Nocardioides sp. SYSU D00038]